MGSYEPPGIAKYLAEALLNDFFVVYIITSQTQGKNESMNLPFGLGKTSLEWWLSYILHGEEVMAVRKDFFYYPSKLFKAAMPTNPPKPPIPHATYDDVQATAPAVSSVPAILQRMAGYLTTNRPEIKTMGMTAQNINSVAAPLRKLCAFEIIVYERGCYEVQQIKYRKNFKNPHEDMMRLEYRGQSKFEKMPAEEQAWYDQWRREQKIPQAQKLIADLEKYEKKELPKLPDDEEKRIASEAGKALSKMRGARKFEEPPLITQTA